jgi:hypothetical protein
VAQYLTEKQIFPHLQEILALRSAANRLFFEKAQCTLEEGREDVFSLNKVLFFGVLDRALRDVELNGWQKTSLEHRQLLQEVSSLLQ